MSEQEAKQAAGALAPVEDIGKQLQVLDEAAQMGTAMAVSARAEVEVAMLAAKRFPRDEDTAFQKILRACGRYRFAYGDEKGQRGAEYRFRRGGSNISGPSVYFAREMGRLWGNLDYGFKVIRETDEEITLRGFAWDFETNTRIMLDDSFRKLQQRRVGGETKWVSPDERDLRELINRRGAILERNCLLRLFPNDFVEDALEEAHKTIAAGIKKDPDKARKEIIAGFDKLNVKPKQIAEYLGCPIDEATPAQIADLRGVYAAIRDGGSTWADYRQNGATTENGAPSKTGTLDTSKLKATEGEYLNDEELDAFKHLRKTATDLGMDKSELHEWLKAECGTTVFKKVPRQHFKALTDFLTSRIGELADAEDKERRGGGEPTLMGDAAIKRIMDAAEAVGLENESLQRHLGAEYGSAMLEKLPAEFETEILKWVSQQK